MGFVFPDDEDVVYRDSDGDEDDTYTDFYGCCETGAYDDEGADDQEGEGKNDVDSDGSHEVRPRVSHVQQAGHGCQCEQRFHRRHVHYQGLHVV